MEVKAKFDHFNVNVTDLNRSIEFFLFEGIRFYRSS